MVSLENAAEREAYLQQVRAARPAPVDAVLDVGDAETVRGSLQEGPLLRCHAASDVCVWVTEVPEARGAADPRAVGRLLALDAAGPFRYAVPPLGEVRWCPSTGWYQDAFGGSAFSPDGHMTGGPAHRGLDRYAVVEHRGRLLVDLRRWEPGPDLPDREVFTVGDSDGDGTDDRDGAPCEFPGGSPVGVPYLAFQREGAPPLPARWTSPRGLAVHLIPSPDQVPAAYSTGPRDGPAVLPQYAVRVSRPGPLSTVDRDAPTIDVGTVPLDLGEASRTDM